MPHIHTEPGQYDITASAYIIRTDGDEPRLLLHKHKVLGMYLQYGGHVELHEDPWAAVSHEITEESGYTLAELQLLQPKDRLLTLSEGYLHPQPVAVLTVRFGELDHYHTDIPYIFTAAQPPQGERGADESADEFAVTEQELRAIPKGEIPENVREIGLHGLTHCLRHWETVSPDVLLAQPVD